MLQESCLDQRINSVVVLSINNATNALKRRYEHFFIVKVPLNDAHKVWYCTCVNKSNNMVFASFNNM